MFNVDGTSDVSFIRRADSNGDFWAIDPTGDYTKDCARGRAAAQELQRAMFFGATPLLLGSVARDIAHKGRWTGLEVGFFHEMGEAIVRSPHEVICLARRPK